MLVSAGSASTTAISPPDSARSSAATSLNSTATVVAAGSTGGPTLPVAARRSAAGPATRERLVDRAVVAVAVDEHLRPPGDLPREPQGGAVGVGRGEREQPARHREAARQLLGDPDRVLGREHRRDAARRLPRDRVDGRGGRVAGHRARVAEREVDVLVAVDVDDPRPSARSPKVG